MKSPYSNSQGNCVNVEHVTFPDGEYIEVTDTKGKTGSHTRLLFTREEWDAFERGARDGVFSWDAIKASARFPENSDRVADRSAEPIPQRRTPENIAYVNGRHAERRGHLVLSYVAFCRRFNHSTSDTRSRAIYDAYLTGRRAEAHEVALGKGE